jgi:hypothetical protein
MPVGVRTLVMLLVAFQVKHLVADFLLQTKWTIGKEQANDWLAPLMAHAGGHAVITMLVALWVNPAFWWLGIVDLVVHAAIDRGKALATRALGAQEGEQAWWRLFGIDQMLHHLTHLTYSVVIVFY